ncbi:MAG: hypothetical protein ABJP76_01745 [Flavobacteriaceae bacterium]
MEEVKYQRFVFKEVQSIEVSIKVLDGYNKTRFSRKKNKDENTLLEAAKFAHDNELIYFATVIENENPFAHLEINKAFFRVYFLDELNRNYMSYDFIGKSDLIDWQKEILENKLFLSTVNVWEFNKENEKAFKTFSYIFKPNGQVTVVERNLLSNEQITSEAKDKIDVSANWEDYPEFGAYKNLIKKERGIKSLTV